MDIQFLAVDHSYIDAFLNAKANSPSVYLQGDYWRMKIIAGLAVIRISDYMDYTNIKDAIIKANHSDEVDAILLDIESNGGDVSGVQSLSDAIFNSQKPVVSYIKNAKSAGYWLASQADYIIAERQATESVGSIGVLAVHRNMKKYNDIQGVGVTIITDSNATEKTIGNPFEKLSTDDIQKIQTSLDATKVIFLESIARSRKKVDLELVGDAKSYFPETALELGLIDKIGSYEDAFEKAKALAKKTDVQISKPYINNYKMKAEEVNNLLSDIKGFLLGKSTKKEAVEVAEEKIVVVEPKAETETGMNAELMESFKTTIEAFAMNLQKSIQEISKRVETMEKTPLEKSVTETAVVEEEDVISKSADKKIEFMENTSDILEKRAKTQSFVNKYLPFKK